MKFPLRTPALLIAAGALFISGAALAQPIGYEGARHLLTRTGFGAVDAEIRDYAKLERATAVDRVLATARREPSTQPPAFTQQPALPYSRLRAMSPDERKEQQRRNVEQGLELREWWLREMMATPSPVTEKMTLFWHNHFATSQQKVRSPHLMYRQNVLLRRESLGNFASLLHAVAKDPAMLVYLDQANSRKQAPNENFAREVMELFTLGEGHGYSERDIKEAARAFTGWSLDRDTMDFTFRRAIHDDGEKTLLGRSGRFDGDQVLDVLLARRETAQFITAKLWKEFVSPTPDSREVTRLAGVWRDARYEVKPLLRAMLLSDDFWAPDNRATLIKSPVELVVGTLRTFDIRPFTLRPAVVASALLGQNPMSPPNVKGWPGGEAWINSSTLLGRKQLMERIFRGADPRPENSMTASADPAPAMGDGEKGREARYRKMMDQGMQTYSFDWDRWSRSLGKDTPLQGLVLAQAPVNPPASDSAGAELVRQLVADPAYQLK
ncbi:MAG: DUF1800 domain-containing protein [Usitatibacter sp.]